VLHEHHKLGIISLLVAVIGGLLYFESKEADAMSLKAEDLQIFRFVHNMSRKQLADRLGVSYSYVHNLEKEYVPFTAEIETKVRERLGLTDYRLSKLRNLYAEMKKV
jgi:DNA-binding XRE family transcriptional regulator